MSLIYSIANAAPADASPFGQHQASAQSDSFKILRRIGSFPGQQPLPTMSAFKSSGFGDSQTAGPHSRSGSSVSQPSTPLRLSTDLVSKGELTPTTTPQLGRTSSARAGAKGTERKQSGWRKVLDLG